MRPALASTRGGIGFFSRGDVKYRKRESLVESIYKITCLTGCISFFRDSIEQLSSMQYIMINSVALFEIILHLTNSISKRQMRNVPNVF